MRVKRLTRCALLTAIALAIFVLEAQIPIPFPVPGMKLGLSNIITLFALFSFGWKDALAIVGRRTSAQSGPDGRGARRDADAGSAGLAAGPAVMRAGDRAVYRAVRAASAAAQAHFGQRRYPR